MSKITKIQYSRFDYSICKGLPDWTREECENFATKMLSSIYPKALKDPQAIPIDQIAENLFHLKIKYQQGIITEHRKPSLIITSKDDDSQVINNDVIIIDSSIMNSESLNFVLATALIQWIAEQTNNTTNTSRPIFEKANGIALCVLMPKDVFIRKKDKLITEQPDISESELCHGLSKFFKVPIQIAGLRLLSLNFEVNSISFLNFDYRKDFLDQLYLNEISTTLVSLYNAYDLYKTDTLLHMAFQKGSALYDKGNIYHVFDNKYEFLFDCKKPENLNQFNFRSRTRSSNEPNDREKLEKLREDLKEYQESIKLSGKEPFNTICLRLLEKKRLKYQNKFEEATGIYNRDILYKLKRTDYRPSLETVIAILIGLKLPNQCWMNLLNLAGYHLTEQPVEIIYAFILDNHLSIDEANVLLEHEGFRPLGTKSNK